VTVTALRPPGCASEAATPEDVLDFWFPPAPAADHAAWVRQADWWFGGGSNAAIAARFARLADEAARGRLDHWSRQPRSRLALIIALDQFPRALYPGTPRAYAQDAAALALALEGLEIGHYASLATPWEKTFFFMPLGHSEELRYVETAVTLAEALAAEAPLGLERMLHHSVSQARGHRDVIATFGRHPHRNAILGRTSTPAEIAYLSRGRFVHLRRPPQ
jgi:uncharacterized protein (DUF924 family)